MQASVRVPTEDSTPHVEYQTRVYCWMQVMSGSFIDRDHVERRDLKGPERKTIRSRCFLVRPHPVPGRTEERLSETGEAGAEKATAVNQSLRS